MSSLLDCTYTRITHLLIEVGVVHGVARVGQRYPHRVCAVLQDGLLQRLEVACIMLTGRVCVRSSRMRVRGRRHIKDSTNISRGPADVSSPAL